MPFDNAKMLNFASLNQTRDFNLKSFVVISDSIRDTLKQKRISSCLGDGGCSSTMTQ